MGKAYYHTGEVVERLVGLLEDNMPLGYQWSVEVHASGTSVPYIRVFFDYYETPPKDDSIPHFIGDHKEYGIETTELQCFKVQAMLETIQGDMRIMLVSLAELHPFDKDDPLIDMEPF